MNPKQISENETKDTLSGDVLEKEEMDQELVQNINKNTSSNSSKMAVSLSDQIFEKIKAEEIIPHARWIYSTRECGLWLLWFITVVIGALAVAVVLFVISHQRFAIYELTHQNFLTFAVDVLPVLWLILFMLGVFLAVLNMRYTKRGYRYPLWQIIGSSVVLSLALGAVLHLVGAGFSLDQKMGAWTKGYLSQERLELGWWQNPAEGRLVGSAMFVRESADTDMRFLDMTGDAWQIEFTELKDHERQLLESGAQVRIIGIEEANLFFHACGVMPWIQNHDYRGGELAEVRRGTLSKMDDFKDNEIVLMSTSTSCGKFAKQFHRKPKSAW